MTRQNRQSNIVANYCQALGPILRSMPEDPGLDSIRDALVSACQNPEPSPPAGAACGNLLLDAGLIDEAESLFETLARQFPSAPAGYAGLAQAAMRKCAWKTALDGWDLLLERFDRGARPYWRARRAAALVELDRLDEAEQIFQALSQETNMEYPALVGLAQIAMRRGLWADALERWTQVRIYPGQTVRAASESALAITLCELGKTDEAEQVAHMVLRNFPKEPAGIVVLAQIAVRRRQWDLALTNWDAALTEYARQATPSWRLSRARVLHELGRSDKAVSELRALLRADPTLAALRLGLVHILLASGRPGEAITEIEAAPDEDVALLMLKIPTLIRLGRMEMARTEFRRALAIPTELSRVERLFTFVPQLYEGWRRTEAWLRLQEKIPARRGESADELDRRYDPLRLRLMIALRDYDRILDKSDNFNLPANSDQNVALKAVVKRLRQPQFPGHDEAKIFCIGLTKTGTTSIATALRKLGFETLHWMNPLTHEIISNEDFYLYDAFADTPVSMQFERLFHLFPRSKFIYTTRPLNAWRQSILRHFARNFELASFREISEAMRNPDRFPYGNEYRRIHISLYYSNANYTAAYKNFSRRVSNFFAESPDERFLQFDIFRGDGWTKLCRFVERPAPNVAFPWENKAPS